MGGVDVITLHVASIDPNLLGPVNAAMPERFVRRQRQVSAS